MIELIAYTNNLKKQVNEFLEVCMPESGRNFEPFGRHKALTVINKTFECCWCLLNNEKIIGTVAIKKLSVDSCELKMMYLLRQYHGQGLGQKMIQEVLNYAKSRNYKKIYLDTMKSSEKAIKLYKKNGFIEIERYNNNLFADIFMVREII